MKTKIKNKKLTLRDFRDMEPDFTIWLAKSENIHHIEKLINKRITMIQPEWVIRNDSLDIFGKTEDGCVIAIENQYHVADNDHFGKLLEYASYVNADIIILISESVDEEHFKIMSWLNNNSDKMFYHIIAEYYEGEKEPQFHILNNSDVKIRRKRGGGTSKPSNATNYRTFWKLFEKVALEQYPSFKEDFSYNLEDKDDDAVTLTFKPKKHYSLNVYFRKSVEKGAGAELQFSKRNRAYYEFMEEKKTEFVELYGSNVEFRPLANNPTIKPERIKASITNEEKYEIYAKEMVEMIYKLKKVARQFDEIC